jgi:hypothetical protein
MSKGSEQDFEGADESDTDPPRRGRAPTARERPFKLGPLGTLNQVIVALDADSQLWGDQTRPRARPEACEAGRMDRVDCSRSNVLRLRLGRCECSGRSPPQPRTLRRD